MYRVATQEPQWLTLIPAQGKQPAVEILFAPITRKMRRQASRESRRALPEMDPTVPLTELTEEQYDALADVGDLSSATLIRLGARDWRGLAGPDGKKLPFSADALELVLADERLFAAAELAYVAPDAARLAEKNGLSGSPAGTGSKATPGKAIASSAAAPKRKAAAKPAHTA